MEKPKMIRENEKLYKDTQKMLKECSRSLDVLRKKNKTALREEEINDIFDEIERFIERDLLLVAVTSEKRDYYKLLRKVMFILKEKRKRWLTDGK